YTLGERGNPRAHGQRRASAPALATLSGDRAQRPRTNAHDRERALAMTSPNPNDPTRGPEQRPPDAPIYIDPVTHQQLHLDPKTGELRYDRIGTVNPPDPSQTQGWGQPPPYPGGGQYPSAPYPGAPYPGGPYPSAPYPGGQYPSAPYQGTPYPYAYGYPPPR